MDLKTIEDVFAHVGSEVPEHLIEGADIADASEGMRQGDVAVFPIDALPIDALPNVDTDLAVDVSKGVGYKIVEGDVDRNSHMLVGTGTFYPISHDQVYGYLVVADKQETILSHTGNHGPGKFTEGTYQVMGQMDAATQQRVAD